MGSSVGLAGASRADYSRADPHCNRRRRARLAPCLAAASVRARHASGAARMDDRQTADHVRTDRRSAGAAFPPTAEHADLVDCRRLRLGGPWRSGCGRCRWWPEFPTTSCAGSSAWPTRCYENTRRFARGLPANNALLWGARGMGKSSLVKAIHARVNEDRATGAGADRDPPRGHREPAAPAASPGRERPPLPAVLRRPVVRCRRDQLQVAQGRARGRHRGPARQRPVLRHLEPPPPDAAPDDRQ